MDHADLIEELPVIEKLTPAERIAIARQRRTFQLLKWQEREKIAEALVSNGSSSSMDSYERTPKIAFNSSITLLEATTRNDLDEVARLLKIGADPNSHNEDGLTPLHQCAIDNNEHMLQLLLENGADVNARDTELWTPLHAAACCGHAEIVRHLIDRGARLLAVNADGNMPYDICDDEYTLDLIESEMAKRGITQEDIDEERLSTERRMLEDMQDLRDEGGDLEYKDEHGATPLHIASANGFYNCVQFLLDSGCSPHVGDNDGWQPVHAAACWAQADILELLVAYGADINACTPMNEVPLDLCEDEGARAVIMSLQVEFQRRQLMSFQRDSRRMSKRRKPTSKFESPPTATTVNNGQENHLASTRGAIRRLSVRDKAGVTLARLEARKEAALMRRFSFEEHSNPMLAKQEAANVISSDQSSKKRQVSAPSILATPNGNKVIDLQSSATPVNGLDRTDSIERSSLMVELITIDNDSPDSIDHHHPNSQGAKIESVKIEVNDHDEDESDGEHASTRELSTTEWLKKLRQEEEQGVSPLERSSVSSARKGGRRKNTPTRDPMVANGSVSSSTTTTVNGQVVSHNRQHSSDSVSSGRVLIQQRGTPTIVAAGGDQLTRTLVPGEPGFSRHPMTLTDLKKQRAEDRKTTTPVPRSSPPTNESTAIMAMSGPTSPVIANDDTTKARFRSPSDAVVGRRSPRSRSPKLGMRCCRII